jgi:uncharacterized protein (DUF697 family)
MSSYTSEAEFGEYGEYEGEGEGEYEGEYGEYEGEYGEQGGAGGLLGEAEEIGLASELLEINSEAELEQFLGGLISKIGRAAGGLLKSPVGQALGGILKGVAKKALPMVGGALGSMIAPGVGTALGSQLGSAASNMFELELESIPQEAAEFEVARRLVGLTAAAASHAAQAPAGANPRAVARDAVAEAAREYAPGLHRQMMQRSGRTRPGGRGVGARQAAQRPGHPGMRPRGGRGPGRGYGGFADYTFAEPAPDDWDADGDGSFASDEANGTRPTAGRWVRRGRRIVLLGI